MPWGTDNKYLILVHLYKGERIIMRMSKSDYEECNLPSYDASLATPTSYLMTHLKLLIQSIKPDKCITPIETIHNEPNLSIVITEAERQLLVFALKVMLNTVPHNSTYAEVSGAISQNTLLQEI